MFSFFKRKKQKKTDQIPEPPIKAGPEEKKESLEPPKPASDNASPSAGAPPVKIYSLSTCSHCKATKKFLSECTVQYDFIDVDLLEGEERKAILEDVKKFNPKCSFPTIVIGEKVIVGYVEKEIKEALGM